ncbi:MAG: hypothetical protein JWR84_2592 [Caulobacter sp.]|nr:hypothetical protein [Caulobacter sp.]
MSDSTVVIRVDEELKVAFAGAAKDADRTVSQLIRDYMRDYVRSREDRDAYDQWFRAGVEEGLAEARAGKLIPGDEIEAHFARRRDETRKAMATKRGG